MKTLNLLPEFSSLVTSSIFSPPESPSFSSQTRNLHAPLQRPCLLAAVMAAASTTASSATPWTGADMNAADATAKATETSSAAAWVSATSFGGTQSEAVVNIAAASLVWWRLLVDTADGPFETPGHNAASAVGYGIAVAIMLWLLLWIHKRRLLVPNGASSQCVPATRGSSSPQAPRNTNTRWL